MCIQRVTCVSEAFVLQKIAMRADAFYDNEFAAIPVGRRRQIRLAALRVALGIRGRRHGGVVEALLRVVRVGGRGENDLLPRDARIEDRQFCRAFCDVAHALSLF